MSDGILSQDEIDALIGGGSKAQEEAELPKESGEPAEEFDASAIGEILRLAMSATVEGLAIMTDAEGRLESKGVHRTTLEELREDLSTGLVAVQYELAGALDGILISLFPAQSAGTLNEIVRGGDAPEGGDDDLSGFREVVAEMALHLSDAFTSALDARVEVGALEPEQVAWHEESEPPLPVAADEDVVVAEFELFIGDATCTVVHLIPADVTGGIGGVFAREEHLAGSEEVAAAQEPLESPPLKEPATGVRRSGGRGLARRRAGFSGKIAPAQFEELGRERAVAYPRNIDLLLDVPLQVTVELGRTRMQIREVLELGKGSIIELEKLAGEPVEVYVNGKLIAKGEVVTIDENFGVKITDIVSPRERVSSLQ